MASMEHPPSRPSSSSSSPTELPPPPGAEATAATTTDADSSSLPSPGEGGTATPPQPPPAVGGCGSGTKRGSTRQEPTTARRTHGRAIVPKTNPLPLLFVIGTFSLGVSLTTTRRPVVLPATTMMMAAASALRPPTMIATRRFLGGVVSSWPKNTSTAAARGGHQPPLLRPRLSTTMTDGRARPAGGPSMVDFLSSREPRSCVPLAFAPAGGVRTPSTTGNGNTRFESSRGGGVKRCWGSSPSSVDRRYTDCRPPLSAVARVELCPSPSSFPRTKMRLFGSATDAVDEMMRGEDVMSTWAGSSRSNSRHVVHFISSSSATTVEEAIWSVLPNASGRRRRPRRDGDEEVRTTSGSSLPGDGDLHVRDGDEGVVGTTSGSSLPSSVSFIDALIREGDDPSSPYHHDASRFGRGRVAVDVPGSTRRHGDDDEEEEKEHSRGRPSSPDTTVGFFDRRPGLEPYELLALGSVWFLPASAPRDPALGGKPVRLTAADRDRILEEGDYLRVHFDPRRFPVVHEYDWGERVTATTTTMGGGCGRDDDDDGWHERPLPGVIVSEDLRAGYVVIEKPAGVPVHSTVDNALENVSVAYGRALLGRIRAGNVTAADLSVEPEQLSFNDKRYHQRKKRPLLYVTTPQRLDQNTSGILLVSTKKSFASYFARLLRRKTRQQLDSQRVDGEGRGVIVDETDNLIHKKYRCLVCVCPRTPARHEDSSSARTSMHDELNVLRELASNRSIITHFLEPSIRAPKVFATRAGNSSWAECMMKITDVGDGKCVRGSKVSDTLALDLWGTIDAVPSNCSAVAEIEVELLTGRTHQIRGQLAAEGFPIVGDVLYGGANVPPHYADGNESDITRYVDSETLALQCVQLSFPYPDFTKTSKGDVKAVPSDKWKKFRLDSAWWTPFIERV